MKRTGEWVRMVGPGLPELKDFFCGLGGESPVKFRLKDDIHRPESAEVEVSITPTSISVSKQPSRPGTDERAWDFKGTVSEDTEFFPAGQEVEGMYVLKGDGRRDGAVRIPGFDFIEYEANRIDS
jgi:hypothetical protein